MFPDQIPYGFRRTGKEIWPAAPRGQESVYVDVGMMVAKGLAWKAQGQEAAFQKDLVMQRVLS